MKIILPLLFLLLPCVNVAQPQSEKMKQEPASLRNNPLLFDSLRYKWKEVLTGGEVNTADSDYLKGVGAIVADANSAWLSMLGVSAREASHCLWPDLKDSTRSSTISGSYSRLMAMAKAYQTPAAGGNFYRHPRLKEDIISGLDWLYTNRYFVRTPFNNWYDWEIAIPLALNNVMILMYEDLTRKQIEDWSAVIEHFSPDQSGEGFEYWGANRAWRALAHALGGIVAKSEAKLILARDGLSDLSDGHTGIKSVFKYVTEKDGFYRDGSFIQHYGIAYTGGYGNSLLGCISDVLYLLHATPWQVTDPDSRNVYEWVYNSFQPLIFKHGQFMDMVRGREISRYVVTDIKAGIFAITSFVRLAQSAPPAHAIKCKQIAKYLISGIEDYYGQVSLHLLRLSKEIMNDPSIRPIDQPVMNKVFAGMDRVVHLRKGWGFGLSMNSARQSYYEAHTFLYENGKGWYTAEGMTYMYLSDKLQYGDNFWPTVNPYRLPGITVDSGLHRPDYSGYTWNPVTYGSKTWVGGASDGTFGVAGMEQDAWGADLTSKKSWFMFDDEVVALGSGITSSDDRPIQTIIDNRKISSKGDNRLTVNGGMKKPGGRVDLYENTSWIFLAGNVPGADMGYYFPNKTVVYSVRESRSGNWSAINGTIIPAGDPTFRNNFQELWLHHGKNPKGSTYAYVLLPRKSAKDVGRYAANADITVLENSPQAQAVKENKLHVIGINFWNDAPKSISVGGKKFVTSNKKASVLIKESATEISVSISDPTQNNNGTIEIEIDQVAIEKLVADKEITVLSLSPTIKLSVQTALSYGKSFTATFSIPGKKQKK